MTTATSSSTATTSTPPALQRLRAFHARAAARGPGVAALLALGGPPTGVAAEPVPAAVLADGARLAARARAEWRALASGQRDDDLGVTTSVLHALAHGEVHEGVHEGVHGGMHDVVQGSAVPGPRRPAHDDRTFSAHVAAFERGRVLRVLNFHNTPPSRREALRAELAAFSARHRLWTPAELAAVTAGGAWPDDPRPGALVVFYEGYATSASVAAPVCDELGISAWFAVCTGFVDAPAAEQELFARSHSIGLVAEDLAGPRLAMTWDEVADLAERHAVLPHTASHAGIEETPTDEDLQREVLDPAQRLRALTGATPAAFAWLHGSGPGMSARHDDAVRAAGYPHLLSATRVTRP